MQDARDIEPIIRWFLRSGENHPGNCALSVDGTDWRYSDLMLRSGNICNAIRDQCGEDSGMVAIFGHRTVDTYAGLLGILWSGNGYVPLNPKFPNDRTAYMLDRSGTSTVVVDTRHFEQLLRVLESTNSVATIILASASQVDTSGSNAGDYNIVQVDPATPLTELPSIPKTGETDIAYLLFTSGSTGQPKGVGITHRNCNAYVANIIDRYSPGPHDVFSQMFDLTFDLSVHDMFVCWGAAARLCSPPERAVMAPAKFIQESGITFWFSVPSTIGFLRKFRLLKKGAFPSIRWSLYCGETLTVDAATDWQEATPNSVIENLYGPTEATIAFTAFRCPVEMKEGDYERNLVPIGSPLGGQAVKLVDENLEQVTDGEVGEICLGGDQLTPGYWRDDTKTSEQFIKLGVSDPNGIDRWYRTGDVGRLSPNQRLTFLGRNDNQIKIFGHRIELGEVEAVLRRAAETDFVVALPWYDKGTTIIGIMAVVAGEKTELKRIREYCSEHLPPYMVPKRACALPAFPLNANGKVDRNAIMEKLKEMNAFD